MGLTKRYLEEKEEKERKAWAAAAHEKGFLCSRCHEVLSKEEVALGEHLCSYCRQIWEHLD
jgi:hypothetical protein